MLNGIRVMARTRKINGRTDGQTGGGHDLIQPVLDGRIKSKNILQEYIAKIHYIHRKNANKSNLIVKTEHSKVLE